MKITLFVAAALVLHIASATAQTYTNQASASIQATATVVPSLGGSYSEEPIQLASLNGVVGVRDVSTTSDISGVLARHRLLVRFPSLSSVVVTIESDSAVRENVSLAGLRRNNSDDLDRDLMRPGAVVVDLDDLTTELAADNGDFIVTLIYSEN